MPGARRAPVWAAAGSTGEVSKLDRGMCCRDRGHLTRLLLPCGQTWGCVCIHHWWKDLGVKAPVAELMLPRRGFLVGLFSDIFTDDLEEAGGSGSVSFTTARTNGQAPDTEESGHGNMKPGQP